MCHSATAFLVSGVQSDIEAQTGFQSSDGENRISGCDVAHQFASLSVVHLHYEFLLQTSVESCDALHVKGVGCLVHDGAIRQRVRLA